MNLEICRMRFMETHNSHVQSFKKKNKMRKILQEQKKLIFLKLPNLFAYIFVFKSLTGYEGMHNKRKYVTLCGKKDISLYQYYKYMLHTCTCNKAQVHI